MPYISDALARFRDGTGLSNAMAKIRGRPYIQSLGFLSRRSDAVLTFELLPRVRDSRQDWLAAPRGEASAGWSPGLLAFKVRSALGMTDVISKVAPAQVSRAITPQNQGPRLRVKVV